MYVKEFFAKAKKICNENYGRCTECILTCYFDWKRDSAKEYPKIHPAQKPVNVLKRIIQILTDPGDIVIDPCSGSGTTLRACMELGRSSYGFEISKDFYKRSKEEMLNYTDNQMSLNDFPEVLP